MAHKIILIFITIAVCVCMCINFSLAEDFTIRDKAYYVQNYINGNLSNFIPIYGFPYIGVTKQSNNDYYKLRCNYKFETQKYYSYIIYLKVYFSNAQQANSLLASSLNFGTIGYAGGIEDHGVTFNSETNRYAKNFYIKFYSSVNSECSVIADFISNAVGVQENWYVYVIMETLEQGEKFYDVERFNDVVLNNDNLIMAKVDNLQNSVNNLQQQEQSIAQIAHSDAVNAPKYEKDYIQSEVDSNNPVDNAVEEITPPVNFNNILALLNNVVNVFSTNQVKSTITFPKAELNGVTLWDDTTYNFADMNNGKSAILFTIIRVGTNILFLTATIRSFITFFKKLFDSDVDTGVESI